MNLWNETIETLKDFSLTWDDVKYIGGDDFRITKQNFEEVAKDTDYDSGFGCSEIATDLLIIGDSWWMTRSEYDGSEWWTFHSKPSIENLPVKHIKKLGRGTWSSLEELNRAEEEE